MIKKREDATDKVATIAVHFREIMLELGLDMKDPSLMGTPLRVAKMMVNETCKSLTFTEPPKFTVFPSPDSEMVVIPNIRVTSLCEHHWMPIIGVAHIAYIPKDIVGGLSKFNRVVDYFARKPQLQERLTSEIGVYLQKQLKTDNLAVVIRAKHFCTCARGVMDDKSDAVTSYLQGNFRKAEVRSEMFTLIKL